MACPQVRGDPTGRRFPYGMATKVRRSVPTNATMNCTFTPGHLSTSIATITPGSSSS
jgi:hypothetical protein